MQSKPVIAYTHSSSKQWQQYSLDAQLAFIKTFCKKNNLEILTVFQETTCGKKMKRPKLEIALLLGEIEQVPIIAVSISHVASVGNHVGQFIKCFNSQTLMSIEDNRYSKEYELHFKAVEVQREKQQIPQITDLRLQNPKKKGNPRIDEAQKLGVAKVRQNADEFASQFKGLLQAMESV